MRRPIRYGDVVGTLALFVALGGTGYAVTQIDANSVGTKQLKKGAVTSKKVKDRTLLRKDFKRGQVPAGATGPQGPQGLAGSQGPEGPQGPAGPATQAQIAANSLTGEQIDESTLSGVNAATLGGTALSGLAGIGRHGAQLGAVACNDDDHGTPQTCHTVTLSLPRTQRVLLLASGHGRPSLFDDNTGTGSGTDEAGWVSGFCGFFYGGAVHGPEREITIAAPSTVNTTIPFAINLVTDPLAAGTHVFELRCSETDGDIDWGQLSLDAVALAAD